MLSLPEHLCHYVELIKILAWWRFLVKLSLVFLQELNELPFS